jgi:hypothetical protein
VAISAYGLWRWRNPAIPLFVVSVVLGQILISNTIKVVIDRAGPSSAREGQIQLREKSTDRLWNRHRGGPERRIWLPSLGTLFAPPERTSWSPHHDREVPVRQHGVEDVRPGPALGGGDVQGNPFLAREPREEQHPRELSLTSIHATNRTAAQKASARKPTRRRAPDKPRGSPCSWTPGGALPRPGVIEEPDLTG